ncbi:hypothetical protein OEZ85_011056 [Tetradesmus obliquus]|uniref:Uncharacterized protein n=1 Tax=Tetradesmus obliquus TaxID=3088 RepID=A0ABY8TPC4_TETOB|nr:hypothetical protein OEZ85_011056 [Tetradesmus obliquus]
MAARSSTLDAQEDATRLWWVTPFKRDGTRKPVAQLDKEKKQVLQVVRQLERALDRELMQHELKKVARLVEQEHTAQDILTCPGLLDLPEHHTKWGEVFGASAADNAQAATAGVKHSELNLARNSDLTAGRNQGNRVAAAVQQVPGAESKHAHLEQVDIYHLTVPILRHLKAFGTTTRPANIHAWADLQAVQGLQGVEDSLLGRDTRVTIEADLLEWYSDAFMNSVFSVLTHRDRLQSVPLSRENITACCYTTRAHMAALLNLVPPSMWNEQMNTKTTDAFYKRYAQHSPSLAYDEHTQSYMKCRRMAIAFSPSGSAQTDICKWVMGQQSIIAPRIKGADKKLRKVVRVQLPNKQSADAFRRIMGDSRRPQSLSTWADASCIMVSAPLVNQNQYVYVDSSLLEFNSKAFLLAVASGIHGRSSIRTRSEAIRFLVDAYQLPLQHEAHRPPTTGQLSAYKRYLSSPQCKYSDEDVCMLLASIAPTNDGDGLACTLTAGRLDAYPADFLWLAARSLGAVASHSAGRAKIYGVGKHSVFEHEQLLAEAVYERAASMPKYKSQLVSILKNRLRPTTSSASDTTMLLDLQSQSDINLAKAYLTAFTRGGIPFIDQSNAADGDVLQCVWDAQQPKLTIREPDVNALSDALVHLLLCVLLDSADDADRQLPAEPFHPSAFAYPPGFRTGFIRNLLRHHQAPTATASCCLATQCADDYDTPPLTYEGEYDSPAPEAHQRNTRKAPARSAIVTGGIVKMMPCILTRKTPATATTKKKKKKTPAAATTTKKKKKTPAAATTTKKKKKTPAAATTTKKKKKKTPATATTTKKKKKTPATATTTKKKKKTPAAAATRGRAPPTRRGLRPRHA